MTAPVLPEILAASEATGVSVERIMGRGQDRKSAFGRRIAIRLLRDRELSSPEIGKIVNRDHTTVLHNLRRHEDLAIRRQGAELDAIVRARAALDPQSGFHPIGSLAWSVLDRIQAVRAERGLPPLKAPEERDGR